MSDRACDKCEDTQWSSLWGTRNGYICGECAASHWRARWKRLHKKCYPNQYKKAKARL